MRLDALSELEVRLAHEQGLLRGRSISPYQKWALVYMMSVKRWFVAEVQESALRDLILALDPERFRRMYLPAVDVEEEGVPMNGQDIDAIDRFLHDIDRRQSLNAGRAFGPDEGWR